ncbi:MAG: hypothetical protein KGK17_07060 [Betaproteobacteria bacterium]|nr:hypothetical protein [Betaproteobacteria bacterium]
MDDLSRRWRFFRAGGFDQVRLDDAEDLLAIGSLDQKLWVALSCPVKGIQFDDRTLSFIDADADGQVRAFELISAVHWAADRLVDPSLLGQGLNGIAPGEIRVDTEAGQSLADEARLLADDLGKSRDERLTVEEVSAAQAKHAVRALAAWEASGAGVALLGESTEAAFGALQAVSDKIDDYFLRCRLSAFDARAGDALNAPDEAFKALATDPSLQSESIARLPLARIASAGNLPLRRGLNPGWAAALETFRAQVVVPILGEREALMPSEWQMLKEKFSGYAAWRGSKPDGNAVDDSVRQLEQLARYVRDLMKLANNFVAFKDFYTRQGKATFQTGTLYLDGRSCELCITVADPAKHAVLATLSRICLVYCDCIRGDQKMTIAAAFTAGDSDQLMVGRNGVFYDRQGNDWDATIIKIIDHPISLRQAFWSPYKRLAKMVGEQLQKLAASKTKENQDRIAQAATDSIKKGASTAAPAHPVVTPVQQAFDVGKFAGILAAAGLAVGAIGTALASIVIGVLALKWWQMPLALAGFMLAISGPAVILAWFKLRTRNLGPILDANGWAINARAFINIPFGTSLTHVAELPPNAERSVMDPYAEKKPLGWVFARLLLLLVAVIAIWWVVSMMLS